MDYSRSKHSWISSKNRLKIKSGYRKDKKRRKKVKQREQAYNPPSYHPQEVQQLYYGNPQPQSIPNHSLAAQTAYQSYWNQFRAPYPYHYSAPTPVSMSPTTSLSNNSPIHTYQYPTQTTVTQLPVHQNLSVRENSLSKSNSNVFIGSSSSGQEQVQRSQPMKSRRKNMKASSIYKGVSYHKRDECYMARVWENSKPKHIGSFKSELLAAVAVDRKLEILGRDESFFNFANNLERDLACEIVKLYEKSPDNFEFNTEEEEIILKRDKNDYPNCVEQILRHISNSLRKRKNQFYSKPQINQS